MGEDQGQVGTAVESQQRDPDQIRREIEQARQDLGDTVAALAAKTDVKARAKEKAEEVKAGAQSNRVPLIAAGVVGALVLLVLVRRGN